MTAIYDKNSYIRFNKQLTCISRRYWPERYRFDSRDNRLLFDYLEVYIPEELGLNTLKCNPYPGDKKVKSLKLTGRAAYSKKEAVHER